ncbi:MAG: hypothetical protein H0V44_06625 [Planctomycetes bacterium]|nr:hypothetical protein [Planctomycetota bacterium]
MTILPSPSERARIDEHLSAVERALASTGVSEIQRRGVVDDLSAQIADMLAERGSSPSAADVDAVIARLDAPEAFAAAWSSSAPRDPSSTAPGVETAARVSFWCAVLGVPAGVAVGMIATTAGHDGGGTGFLVFLGSELTAIGAGLVARRQTLARAGAWIGAALIVTAVTCAIIWPPKASTPVQPAPQAQPPPDR